MLSILSISHLYMGFSAMKSNAQQQPVAYKINAWPAGGIVGETDGRGGARRHNFDPMEVFSKRPGIGVGGVTHATFTCMGCAIHKTAGGAATSPYSHTMSDLPADGELAGDMSSHTRADCMRGAGFASTTSARWSR